MINLSPDLMWWLSAIEIPALAGLTALIWKTRMQVSDTQTALRESLYTFKLEVAKTYAGHGDVNALERRLVSHLLRIEKKLDRTAITTAKLESKES